MKQNFVSIKKEVLAGFTSFFTIAYIIIVNPLILADAGMPYEGVVIATILTSVVGCLIMGLYANAPIILTPGMGVNAFFTYTIIQGMKLSWQEALAAVVISGILFMITASTPLKDILSRSIPQSLKHSITVGIGLFLTFIGLQKGGIIEASSSTFVKLGHLNHPDAILTIIGLILTLILFARNVKGSFLIGIAVTTLIGFFIGHKQPVTSMSDGFSLKPFGELLFAFDLSGITDLSFWIATFSLTMIITFENMGLLYGLLPDQEKFPKAFQANAASSIISGLFGTSPTISTVESASGIAEGGRTGITSITVAILFLGTLFAAPYIAYIPDGAIAPVLIIIGGLMVQQIQHIPLADFTEMFPSFLIIALIPLTYSIVDGLAFGFIAYPLIKWVTGQKKQVPVTMYVIAFLFFMNFVLHTIV
ncbi:NCS2 family permease [Fictibacillus barbaricus]|uniref:AGZA family xanthine/uracil permease-like MFS transporter n=1 Tax=Fictibacillus barbaricus TaxID=182136 RepID=A0ABU1TZY0_9BACL|nr:NCS2 family permease [Fictibacillus barbaricus]MDR7072768.1 AGZA family xanthine/uracil permease-like MFS transporter [Fictibacillus barbaricus]